MKDLDIKTPKLFWLLTIFFLLWNIMGVLSFFTHTFITEEALSALPANERALYGEYSLCITIIFAIATFVGLFSAFGLVMKKKWAKQAAIVSLLAVIPQMIHNVFFTTTIEVYGLTQAVTMPILVVILSALLVWWAMFGIKKHWLR